MVEESAYREAMIQLAEYRAALLDIRKQLESIMTEVLYNIGNDTFVMRKIEKLKNDSDSILLLAKEVEEQYENVKKDLEDYLAMLDQV